MSPKLFLSVPFFLLAVHAPQKQSGASSATMPDPLPVKMGLWENTITTSQGQTQKTQSCFSKESFQHSIENLSPNCKISNQVWTSHSYSSDVSCSTSTGQSTGHLEMQFPNSETQVSTITLTVSAQGKTIPLTIKTESHFINSDCGDLEPGQSKVVE